MIEYWDIYDEARCKTGQVLQRGKELEAGQYHLVAAIWVRNINNKVLLTKRNHQTSWGNCWECPGGAVTSGEDSLAGAKRELFEETGIEASQASFKPLGTTKHRTWFTDTYLLEKDIPLYELKLQLEEISDAKWVDMNELIDMCDKGLVVPVVVEQFKYYKSKIFALNFMEVYRR